MKVTKPIQKYLLPILGVFGAITLFSLLFNEWILEKYYLDYSHLFKPQDEIQKKGLLVHFANLMFAVAFCYIYLKGHETKKSLAQGVRFGLWVSLLVWLPLALTNLVYYPYPRALEIGWLIGNTTQTLLAGITATYLFNLKHNN